uniref:Uncharacterized protein n=1 Tax=Anguilla anguilla TaxID=7936 RepID=A0A0E9XK62_ANGAN
MPHDLMLPIFHYLYLLTGSNNSFSTSYKIFLKLQLSSGIQK